MIESLPLVKSAQGLAIDIVKESYKRPTIVVRFLGSLCSHCMQQIIALNKHASTLHKLDARVVAFSNNPPAKCAEVASDYHIDTTAISICSDKDNACSQALGTTIKESDGSLTELHTFLVVVNGRVQYEYYATTPLMAFQHVFEKIESLHQ